MSQPTSSCDQCGKSFAESDNLEWHRPNCTGNRTTAAAAAAAAAQAPATTVTPTLTSKLQFTLQQSRRALAGAEEQFILKMKEAKRFSTLRKAVSVLGPTMVELHRDYQAYKFRIAVSVVFHKAVDPAVVTLTLLSSI